MGARCQPGVGMPVTHLPHERLLRSKGRHVASEPHLRIQVLEFKAGAYWKVPSSANISFSQDSFVVSSESSWKVSIAYPF